MLKPLLILLAFKNLVKGIQSGRISGICKFLKKTSNKIFVNNIFK